MNLQHWALHRQKVFAKRYIHISPRFSICPTNHPSFSLCSLRLNLPSEYFSFYISSFRPPQSLASNYCIPSSDFFLFPITPSLHLYYWLISLIFWRGRIHSLGGCSSPWLGLSRQCHEIKPPPPGPGQQAGGLGLLLATLQTILHPVHNIQFY